MNRVSIKDVAQAAGVSIATVSNVVNSTGRVSKKTIEHVQQKINELGFVPSAAARNLKNKKTGLIGVFVPFDHHEGIVHDNPFYWHLVSAIEKASKGNDFYFILRGISEEDETFHFVKELDLDGLIIIGTNEHAKIVRKIQMLQVPTVYVDSYLEDKQAYQVLLDDCNGTYIATKKLLSLGHRKIALMSGGFVENRGISYERWFGYKQALDEVGLYDESLFFRTVVSMECGAEVGKRLLEKHSDVTAVITGSDIGAVGLMKYVQEQGVKIPEDLSVIGFDNSFLTQISTPSLTSVHQDIERKGQGIIELLLKQLNKQPCSNRVIKIPVCLVERNSTSPYVKHNE
ncbi:MAG: LacI family DNA-binding transcriptional regulator [Bacillaceae bacterium]